MFFFFFFPTGHGLISMRSFSSFSCYLPSYYILTNQHGFYFFVFPFYDIISLYSLTFFLFYSVRIQSITCMSLAPFYFIFQIEMLMFYAPNLDDHSVICSLQKPFFSNFGAIVTFSILGTFIASVVTGVLV